jgi:hypothetical protein
MTVIEFRPIKKYMIPANSPESVEALSVKHESRGKGLVWAVGLDQIVLDYGDVLPANSSIGSMFVVWTM